MLDLPEAHYKQQDGRILAQISGDLNGKPFYQEAWGNGRLNAVNNALKELMGVQYTLETYTEHALETGSDSQAAAYVGLAWPDGKRTWGAGSDPDIMKASIKALVSALNNRALMEDAPFPTISCAKEAAVIGA